KAEPVATTPVQEVAKVEAPAAVIEKPVAPVNDVPAPAEEPKAELKILPPAETKISTQSWETPAAPREHGSRRHEERPTFRPERRERREFRNDRTEGGENRTPRERREGSSSQRERREEAPAPRATESKPAK